MDFAEYERTIESPALKHVAHHWNEARGGRSMPAWTDIKPSRIAPYLSLVWSFRYDRARDEFNGRLVGDRIARHIGKDFRGLSLTEAYPPDAVPWVLALFKRVVTEPALYSHAGNIFTQLDHHGFGERILLPLSVDGVTADGVLGATFFNDTSGVPLSLVAPASDAGRWFSIRK